ncbi:hypothetical protein DL98DRAFT_452276 [Cadophora sp. DSE1049]|nr:hypothetical protein DL98DRAFT_452276 [Cadophora sp. DSE1049]
MLGQFLDRRWPLKNTTEILLLEHFTHNLSKFFDFCDQTRHFEIDVPRRARSCQSLLDAIFAVSSRHLCMIKKDFDPYVADFFYQRCLQNLIPDLDKEGSNCNDNLLAATVILRLLEELNVSLAGSDQCHHSLGTQAFLRSQEAQVPSTGLHQAAAWAGIRQEIYASLTMHRRPAIKATSSMIKSLSSSDDCAWANRAIDHCSKVLEFCFGESGDGGLCHDALLRNNMEWGTQRPESYDPLCFLIPEDSTSCPFWDVRLHADWHVMGWQYISLARLILIIHDPNIPQAGIDRQSSWMRVNDQARYALKLLCSIAVSNPTTPAAIVVACMGIKIGGNLVEGREEQRAVLEVLTQTEEGHGWPTRTLRSNLKEVWTARASSKDR